MEKRTGGNKRIIENLEEEEEEDEDRQGEDLDEPSCGFFNIGKTFKDEFENPVSLIKK
jgi:hypothetical protein